MAHIPNLEEVPIYRFLRLCDTYTGPEGRDTLPFTPQASQLVAYDFFSEVLEADTPFIILLYPSNVGPGHRRDVDAGLLLDPFTFRVHWHYIPTSGNNRLQPGDYWEPLDRVLRRWLAIWDSGKYYWDDGLQYPMVRPWIERYLTESLTAWDRLLSCISERLPAGVLSEWQAPLEKTLLTQFEISPFTVEFLSRAKRPAFPLIAPGITVFSEESLVSTYAREAEGSWRRRWTKNAEPDEWPGLLLPTLVERSVPREHPADDSFDKDWGVGNLTVNLLPGLYVGVALETADSVFFVTEQARINLFDFSRS